MRSASSVLRLFAALVAAVIALASCASTTTITTGQSGDGESAAQGSTVSQFEATPEFLAKVKTQVEQAGSMSFEVFTEIDSSPLMVGSRTEPVMTGSSVGSQSQLDLDVASLIGPFASLGGLDQASLTMNMVTDGDIVYLHAPLFAALGGSDQPESDSLEWMTTVAEGWGRIDSSAVTDGYEILASLGLSGGAGPNQLLELLREAGEVVDGGTGEVRGVPTNIARVTVSLQEMIEATGQDLSDVAIGESESQILTDLLSDYDVHIDAQGLVRRIEYVLDLGALADADPRATGFEMSVWQRVDFFDYGEPVEIVLPAAAVDITDDFVAALALGD